MSESLVCIVCLEREISSESGRVDSLCDECLRKGTYYLESISNKNLPNDTDVPKEEKLNLMESELHTIVFDVTGQRHITDQGAKIFNGLKSLLAIYNRLEPQEWAGLGNLLDYSDIDTVRRLMEALEEADFPNRMARLGITEINSFKK